jgi:hypothetical protein
MKILILFSPNIHVLHLHFLFEINSHLWAKNM